VHNQRTTYIPAGIKAAQTAAHWAAAIAVLGLTAWSAILVKESTVRTPLVQAEPMAARTNGTPVITPAVMTPAAEEDTSVDEQIEAILASFEPVEDDTVRWFDGRRVVPVRTIWMKVTAYSPDARSCGKWADGQTATLHSVWTNAMRLVAADTRILPYRSIITVPGYADSEIVPVLDCGGAIKGNRLDVLFPTHEIARKWGVRDLPITVWAYEDELEG
jgi:3D (Asp-Asp-Asp) domain-containing protein